MSVALPSNTHKSNIGKTKTARMWKPMTLLCALSVLGVQHASARDEVHEFGRRIDVVKEDHLFELVEDESFWSRALEMSMSMSMSMPLEPVEPEPPSLLDIPATAAAAGQFETLLAALTVTNLAPILADPAGVFTVFAPTDDAFSALPEGLVGCLIEDSAALTSILLYHVVAGAVFSTDLVDGLSAETLNGESVVFDLSDGVVVNTSTVIAADVEASNGVIHVIDSGA